MKAARLFALFSLTLTLMAQNSLEQRRDALNKLLDEQWQYTMRESPEFATVVGDYRYNDKWSDQSLAHQAQQNEDAKKFWPVSPRSIQRDFRNRSGSIRS